MSNVNSTESEMIGRYKIIEELGRGGTAVLYKALQTDLERIVALKVLLPHLSADTELIKRFQREARMAASLHHPNVVTIYEIGRTSDHFYIAMRYVDGVSLKEYIQRKGKLHPLEALRILSVIARVLDYAHGKGIVHRDVKPSNVLIDSETGQVFLTDFGIAKAAYDDTKLTRTGSFIGTVYYAAPEQLQGDEVDYRADLYALGVMAYEMLTGQVPFAGTTASVLYAHMNSVPPSITDLAPELPKETDGVLRKMLAKRPEDRYEDAETFVSDLERVLGKVPVSLPAGAESRRSRAERKQRAVSHRRLIRLAVSAILLALFAWMAVLFLHRAGQHSRSSAALPPTPNPIPALDATAVPDAVSGRPTPTCTQTPSPSPTFTPTSTPTCTPSPSPSPTPTPYVEVGADVLNVRAGPGTVYDVIGKAHKGDRLKLLARNKAGNWVQVCCVNGKRGWVARSLVVTHEPSSGLKVAENIPPTPTPAPTPTPSIAYAHLLRELGPTWEVHAIAFSPDGRTLASAGAEGVVRLWRVSDGQLLYQRKPPNHPYIIDIWSLAFSPDGKILASGHGEYTYDWTIRLWSVSDGRLIRTLWNQPNVVYSVAFSPDGKLLASLTYDGSIRLWRGQGSDWRLWRTLKSNCGISSAFSPDGSIIACGSLHRTEVVLFEVSTGKVIRIVKGEGVSDKFGNFIYNIAFSPDGRYLAADGGARVWLWRVSDGKLVHTLRLGAWADGLAFSSDGAFVAAAFRYYGEVHLIRVSDGEIVRTLRTGKDLGDSVEAIDFSPDGRLLALGLSNGLVQIWGVR